MPNKKVTNLKERELELELEFLSSIRRPIEREREREALMALAISSPPSSFSLCALGHRPHIRRFSHSHSFLGRNLLEGPCDGGRRRISHSATRAAPPKRFHVCAQAAFSELAPVSAAVYGTLLLGGGLFACK